eukprot:336509_1
MALNNIPHRNKDLVFGFIRDQETEVDYTVIPQLIRYLCLLYCNQNKDEFHMNTAHENIKLNGNRITNDKADSYGSCHLKNIVNKRKHIGKFQINKYDCYIMIGIYNVKFGFDNVIDDPSEWGKTTELDFNNKTICYKMNDMEHSVDIIRN